MRWALDPEQQQFSDTVAGWLDRRAPFSAVRAWLDAADPAPFEQLFADEGWLAVGIDEDAGGQGGGLVELALIAEQLARHAAPSSAWLAAVLAAPALQNDADAIEALVEGRVTALAVDAAHPVDAAPVVTIQGGKLSGTIPLVAGADRAAALLVPVAGPDGLELWAVDADAEGVRVTPVELLDRSRTAAAVAFDGATASRLDVDADALLLEAALRAAVLLAADSLGAAARMRELAVDYSGQRTQYGVPIGSFQAMKHAAAQILVDEEAARSIVFYAAATVDAGDPERALHAATAKAQATAGGARTADAALAMFGAIGYTWEHDLQLLYKRAKLDQELFGAPAVWNERIAVALELSVPV